MGSRDPREGDRSGRTRRAAHPRPRWRAVPGSVRLRSRAWLACDSATSTRVVTTSFSAWSSVCCEATSPHAAASVARRGQLDRGQFSGRGVALLGLSGRELAADLGRDAHPSRAYDTDDRRSLPGAPQDIPDPCFCAVWRPGSCYPVGARRPYAHRFYRAHAGSAAGQGRETACTGGHETKRSPALPDVPTLAEAGLPDQEADTILGILVPARTPRPIIALYIARSAVPWPNRTCGRS
jgi:hypothetical protein